MFINRIVIKNWKNLFSDNLRDYEGYSVGKILKYTKNPDIISFAVGMPSPDTFPKDLIRRASKEILDENLERVFQYSPIPGEDELIDAVIDFLKIDDIHIKSENILITNSGQNGLDLTGRLFIDPEDYIIIDRPTFCGAIVAFEMQKPIYIGVNIQDDGSDINGFRDRIKNIKKRKKLHPKFIYVVPDFQNPAGITMSLEKRNALLDLSYEYDIPIIEDSPYRTLRYRGESIPSIYTLDQKREGTNVIGLYTFSKIFTPGIRLGFNIGPAPVIEKMTNIKESNMLNSPKWNQDLCTKFLRETDFNDYFKGMQDYYRNKLEATLEALNNYMGPIKGVSWTKPEGGYFLWITLPKNVDTMKIFYRAVEKEKVAFVPGEAFYGENPEKNHIRINFSYPKIEKLSEGIQRIAKCIKECL